MKTMKTISEWKLALAKKAAERRRMRIEGEARRRIQLTEHLGRTYVAVDGVPLLSSEQAGGELMDTLRAMRLNYVVYHLGRRCE